MMATWRAHVQAQKKGCSDEVTSCMTRVADTPASGKQQFWFEEPLGLDGGPSLAAVGAFLADTHLGANSGKSHHSHLGPTDARRHCHTEQSCCIDGTLHQSGVDTEPHVLLSMPCPMAHVQKYWCNHPVGTGQAHWTSNAQTHVAPELLHACL